MHIYMDETVAWKLYEKHHHQRSELNFVLYKVN